LKLFKSKQRENFSIEIEEIEETEENEHRREKVSEIRSKNRDNINVSHNSIKCTIMDLDHFQIVVT